MCEGAYAVRIDDAVISVVHIGEVADPTSWGMRNAYAYDVFVKGDRFHSGTDLRSGVGDAVDARAMTGTLLAFLEADAEAYRHGMGAEPDDGWITDAATAEWCYLVGDELSMARIEIEEGDDD
ncbi:hypothetical protein [Pseudonocardia sp. NPDC049154]|uniref:hypothetical protein n=1 Tax=Pseudonocardia sp. NPDC049154 TaxID=3155501 RepID=UPI0033C220EE